MIQQDITLKMIEQSDKDIYLICNRKQLKSNYQKQQEEILESIFK
jgi:hypothetical protein